MRVPRPGSHQRDPSGGRHRTAHGDPLLRSLAGGHGHSRPAACSRGSQEQMQRRLEGLDPARMGNLPARHRAPLRELVLPAWSAGIGAVGSLLYSQVSLAIQSNPPQKKDPRSQVEKVSVF